jgi:aspartate racemase
MEQEFYKGKLVEKYGLEVVIPNEEERNIIHRVIYDELCKGIIREESKKEYLRSIDMLVQDGAEAIIL